MEDKIEGNVPTNTKRVLQIEVSPLIWEILAENGRGFDKQLISPHQIAKGLLLNAMKEKKMLPKKDPTLLALDVIYSFGKIIHENGK